MKITHATIIPFKDQVFEIQMTGEEIVRFFDLCSKGEGGERHPGSGYGVRFFEQLQRSIGNLEELRLLLKGGRLP